MSVVPVRCPMFRAAHLSASLEATYSAIAKPPNVFMILASSTWVGCRVRLGLG